MSQDFEKARELMVLSQLRPQKVSNPKILEAFLSVPRHEFLPQEKQAFAYSDHTLVLRDGLYMLKPFILAKLFEMAEPQSSDKILDLTPATGYSAALFCCLAKEVYALFHYAFPMKKASDLPGSLKKENFFPVEGEAKDGYPPKGPYDIIFIGGAVEYIPESLWDQLNLEGRLVVIFQGKQEERGRALLFTKKREGIVSKTFFETSAPPLPSFIKEDHFVF